MSAMQRSRAVAGPGVQSARLLRPLLDIGRGELRAYLNGRGAAWLEDPMNDDARFRAQADPQSSFPHLEEAGIPAGRIADAGRPSRARANGTGWRDTGLSGRACANSEAVPRLSMRLRLANMPREIGLRALSASAAKASAAANTGRALPGWNACSMRFSADFRRQTLAGCRIGKAPKSSRSIRLERMLIARKPPPQSLGAGSRATRH